MTREQNIALIREKCVAANSDIERLVGYGRHGDKLIDDRPVRLADVLLAINYYEEVVKNKNSWFDEPSNIIGGELILYITEAGRMIWNLRKDNLTEQSDETLEFLYNLLHV